MRLRMLAEISDEVQCYAIGEVVELADVKAERFLRHGHAASQKAG